MLFQLQRLWHDAAQRVGREIDVGGAGLAAFAEGARDRFIQLLQDQRRFAHGAGIARDGAHQLRVVHVLQAAAIFLRAGVAAREHQHGRTRNMRVGDAGDGIGHSRASRNQRHAEFTGEFGMRLRHVDGGTLVADIDDADAFRIEPHPDRHDVAAAQREHALDATTLQETCDQVGGAIRRDFHGATPLGGRGLNQIWRKPGDEQ